MQLSNKQRLQQPLEAAGRNRLDIKIQKVDRDVWIENFSELAHGLVFNEVKPKEWDRIDYALLALIDETPTAYMTCREISHDTIYWQFGGSFGRAKNTVLSYRLYEAMKDWHKGRYNRCITYIENDNFVMLKMAMKIGYKIIGVRNYHGDVLLEHLLEFKEESNA